MSLSLRNLVPTPILSHTHTSPASFFDFWDPTFNWRIYRRELQFSKQSRLLTYSPTILTISLIGHIICLFLHPWAQAHSCTYVLCMFQYILYTTNIITLSMFIDSTTISVPKCLTIEEQKDQVARDKRWWKYWGQAIWSAKHWTFCFGLYHCKMLYSTLQALNSVKCSNPPSMPICPRQFVIGCVHHKPLSKLHLWFYPRHKKSFCKGA
jgi:hypothetical protein